MSRSATDLVHVSLRSSLEILKMKSIERMTHKARRTGKERREQRAAGGLGLCKYHRRLFQMAIFKSSQCLHSRRK
eukprot:scaffold5306_cov92-Skeletonema_marinoi.AAC.2